MRIQLFTDLLGAANIEENQGDIASGILSKDTSLEIAEFQGGVPHSPGSRSIDRAWCNPQ